MFFIIFGLVLLIISADILINASISLANYFGISPLIIGLTLVSVGTSAPELVTCIIAAIHDSPNLIMGNIIGSNIANVWLALSIPALIYPISAQNNLLKFNGIFLLVTTSLFIFTIWDNIITMLEGYILLGFMVSYLYLLYLRTKQKLLDADITPIPPKNGAQLSKHFIAKNILKIIFSSIGLSIGAESLISGTKELAQHLGISEFIIGITVIALGTSIPEILISIMAALKKETDVALGNIIGSNIMNILLILGITSIINPIPIDSFITSFDAWIVLGTTLTILPFIIFKRDIKWPTGILFLALYSLYITFYVIK